MILRKIPFIIFFISLLTDSATPQTEFSQENAYQLLKHLSVDIGPRPMGSPAEYQAIQFAVEKFREYGCDTAYIMPIDRYSHGNTSSGVAVGLKRGLTKRIFVIGGHIDSAEPEIAGANDDGSGSAVVMEAARILCKRLNRSTIVFCCFGGEERGLVGSKHFVADFSGIDSVEMMIQVDMADGRGPLDIDPDAHQSLSAPRWLVGAVVEEYSKLGYTNLRYPTHFFSLNHTLPQGPGSDHEPFLQKGIPSVAFISDVSYPVHTAEDNFENFDPAGLQRAGDIVLKLVDRFDGGIPERKLERYWFYLAGNFPVFIPIWVLSLFVFLTLILAVIVLIKVRKHREQQPASGRIRWTSIKMICFSIIILIFGWFSSDIVSIIKGTRYPWMSNIGMYYLLSGMGAFVGGWFVLLMSRKIRLPRCSYKFFKRTVLILVAVIAVFGFFDLKLAVEPAIALLLISAAMFVRNPYSKIVLLFLSPWWMFRLIFSEWSSIVFHEIARQNIPGMWLLINGSTIVLLSIFLIPFLFALAAIERDAPILQIIVSKFRTVRMLIVLLLFFGGFVGYLCTTPHYDNLWHQEIHLNEIYDITKQTKEITVESFEYLKDISISHGGIDTILDSKNVLDKIQPRDRFDTDWVNIERHMQKKIFGDTTHYDIDLALHMKSRPYTVSILYSLDQDGLLAFDTPAQFRTDKKGKHIDWYSFPDSMLAIPIKFSTIGFDTVSETIEITFNKLAYPVEIRGNMIDVIPRTKFVSVKNY